MIVFQVPQPGLESVPSSSIHWTGILSKINKSTHISVVYQNSYVFFFMYLWPQMTPPEAVLKFKRNSQLQQLMIDFYYL